MPARRARIAVSIAVLLLIAEAASGEGRITLLGGRSHRGVSIVSLGDREVVFRDGAGKESRADIADLVGYLQAEGPARKEVYDASDVAVVLRGGDVVIGRLVVAEEEQVAVDKGALGKLVFPVDDVEELRFLGAWTSTVEKPVFGEEEQTLDVFVYKNLDRLSGTYIEATAGSVVMHGRIGDRHPISHDNLLVVRFADFPAPPPPKGRLTVLLLADGSRITADSVRSDGEHVEVRTVRGESIEFPLRDLLALHQTGGKFVFLSDRKTLKEKITPWIGDVYAWDRARYDHSFLDGPIRSGKERYLKGIGVISGTSLTFEIGEGYRFFTSLIALDDAAGSEGDVVFEVLLDEKSVFRSRPQKVLDRGDLPVRIPPIPLAGARRITLRVAYVDDFVRDYANWIEPVLIR